ncbi:GPP34 family phosphoprotein [Streptomyces sp. NRRL F-525]|uniref:GPP34 family phosphoprotein n=1 Tax=Streptomyces sp. NRRL F-525 TaxID=1463861 RepID=UPI001F269347|nr:GPP34 family phosphoprotein [Streptomyces sp. NRRL F-525]
MFGPAALQRLSLPEEFALLSYGENGRVPNSGQTAAGCAAAELGELALRRRLLVRPRKTRKLGVEIYQLRGEIELSPNTARTGLAWADDLLSALGARAAGLAPRPLTVTRWLRERGREALAFHTDALTERGVLRHRPGTLLTRTRHHPDPVLRTALLNGVRAVRAEQVPLDEHMLFLCDLLDGAGLTKDFGLTLTRPQRLERARGIGAAGALPETLRDTSTVLGFSLPGREGRTITIGD